MAPPDAEPPSVVEAGRQVPDTRPGRRRLVTDWLDRPVVDVRGVPIGVVASVHAGDDRRDAWLAIDVGGLDAPDIVLAPIVGAELDDGMVVVADDRDLVLSTSRAALIVVAEALPHVTPRGARHPGRSIAPCARRRRDRVEHPDDASARRRPTPPTAAPATARTRRPHDR